MEIYRAGFIFNRCKSSIMIIQYMILQYRSAQELFSWIAKFSKISFYYTVKFLWSLLCFNILNVDKLYYISESLYPI